MGIFQDVSRGLVNTLSGLGGDRDKAAHGDWHFTPLDRHQVENAYRSNWMARKAVDIPAFDMMREGWAWQTDDKAIEAIEAEEKRLKVRKNVMEALKQARLYGGAAIIVSDGSEDPSQPLDSQRIRRGGVSFLTVLDRFHLVSGDIDLDPLSPNYMEPLYYDVAGTVRGSVRLHPSRVIRFVGAPLPTDWEQMTDRWGDSVLDAIEIAIRDATAGQQGIAALIQEAKVDVFKVNGFMQGMKSEQYKKAIEDRFGLVNRLKSTIHAVVLDAEDDYQQKTANFSQLPDVQRLLLQIVSGAADIPATRFLGQSPAGLSSTGEHDEKNYFNRISAEQELVLRDVLDRLFDFVVPSALGSYPSDVHYTFKPLWQMSAKERAEVLKAKAEAARTIVGTGGTSLPIIPIEAVSDALVNTLIEDGDLPGIEAAVEEYGKLSEQDDDEDEAVAAVLPPSVPESDPARLADAAPRTLYVHRKLLNADEVIAHFKAQGFETTLPADDMHVTITYSRMPVDWFGMGSTWDDDVTVPRGGARQVEQFGEATVLLFASNMMSWRHEEMTDKGASWDHPEYQPHVTISYGFEGDLDGIEPYQGELRFGPELFSEIREDWQSGITEE